MRSLKGRVGAAVLIVSMFAATSAQAQLFVHDPDFHPGAIQGNDPLVGLPLPGATPQEYAAHLLWNLRAGLNVAALQCQFSPYLRTVDNYNGILAHHAKELSKAYTTIGNYFKRTYGAAKGQLLFDDYSTKTYNGFSTLQAQYGFCQVASDIAKEALARPKGQLYLTAQARLRELRNSLVPAYDRTPLRFDIQQISFPSMPPLDNKCYDKKNQLKKKCRTVAAR
jgi:hypothetical protein